MRPYLYTIFTLVGGTPAEHARAAKGAAEERAAAHLRETTARERRDGEPIHRNPIT